MKVAINVCFGGFGLSNQAIERMADLGHQKAIQAIEDYDPENLTTSKYYLVCYESEERADQILIQVIEEMGKESWGFCAELKIVEIPDNIGYDISEDDGIESIHEQHRSWS